LLAGLLACQTLPGVLASILQWLQWKQLKRRK